MSATNEHGGELDVCRRCGLPIFDFAGTGWLTVDTEDEACGDGEHEPTNPRSDAERIGFTGYVGCERMPCTGDRAATCIAKGDCATEAECPS